MKLTWFGGTTLRAYIGGGIVVVDGDKAPTNVSGVEVRAGADYLLRLDDPAIPRSDLRNWSPRRPERLIDKAAAEPVLFWRGYETSVLIDAVGEAPLFLACDGVYPLGKKWEKDAIVLMYLAHPNAVHVLGGSLVDDISPRLVLLAGDDDEIEVALAMLANKLDTNFMSLEPGLALEV